MVVRIPADPRGGLMRLAFPELSQPEYRALIAMLYCRPRQWDTPRKSELRAIWEYYHAGFRMYPLAESGHWMQPARDVLTCPISRMLF